MQAMLCWLSCSMWLCCALLLIKCFDYTIMSSPYHWTVEDSRKSLTTIMRAWLCPQDPNLGPSNCYMDIQDWSLGTKSQLTSQQNANITIPDLISNSTRIMYVHDSFYITHMPGPAPSLGAEWKNIWWCRVERCPETDYVKSHLHEPWPIWSTWR
jgi:hypothetical protein